MDLFPTLLIILLDTLKYSAIFQFSSGKNSFVDYLIFLKKSFHFSDFFRQRLNCF